MTINSYDVVIVGGGAAGLTAAYDLAAIGDVSFQILEASSRIGGRLEKLEGFTDFPVDIGGEWIHTVPSILKTIANQESEDAIMPETIPYMPTYNYLDEDGEWDSQPWSKPDDYKFVDYTWFDFFNEYIAGFDVIDRIAYNCVVNSIDYTSSPVVVGANCQDCGYREWRAKKVIVTPSIKILQDGLISFTPQLPFDYLNAINNRMQMLSGHKVFLKFRNRFYDMNAFALDHNTSSFNDRFFFDETLGQDSDDNVLGVFMVGGYADGYVEQSDTAIVQSIIDELDHVFAGQASANLIDSVVKNWNKEEYVRGAYINIPGGNECWVPIDTMREPVDNKIFFAGEAIPDDGDMYEWGSADVAALSGRSAARKAVATL